ncbi:hypothetical protein [Streptomyces sp. Root369]|uniref:hypothetical protein n=1 Tax=Streptomyces sp. Root369 TaxID=1736523 RepID=UPI000D14FCA5|nr:hypothetical protein [Streptomyces sp. Root369]
MAYEPPAPFTALAPLIVEEALAQAVNGNPHGGGMLLVPLIEQSRFECYALCVMLASAAAVGMKPHDGPGPIVLEVEDTWTGRPASAADLPQDMRFAALFAAAVANDDRGQMKALFEALACDAHTDAGMGRLVDGVLALFLLAVGTTRALIDHERANPNQEGN